MAKEFCALCGVPLDEFDQKDLICCGERQPLCFSCFIELEPMDDLRRTRVLLDEGRAPVNAESMRAFLDRIEETQAAKRSAVSDLKCLRCGTPMTKLGRKKFQTVGEDLFFDSMEFEVLQCDKCRKVEFFAPERSSHG